MLYKETVEKKIFGILTNLSKEEIMRSFALAGGTALALQLGHRKSIDLDFFTVSPFVCEDIKQVLEEKYNFQPSLVGKNTLKGFIDNVKIDMLAHQYPQIDAQQTIENVRMYSIKDIAAMKLNAITTNGTRIKDFIDIAFLSERLPLNEMLDAYSLKYDADPYIAVRALLYFNDIDASEPVFMMQGKLDWKAVTDRLILLSNAPQKKFDADLRKKKNINISF
jgi:hypothetical protein